MKIVAFLIRVFVFSIALYFLIRLAHFIGYVDFIPHHPFAASQVFCLTMELLGYYGVLIFSEHVNIKMK